MKIRRSQTGMSLVEILVALVISLFLLGGIVQVYVGNKSTYKFGNALAEVQENGRYALDTITRDLRQIGHWGCINFNPADNPDDLEKIADNITGWNAYRPALHDFRNNQAIQGQEGGPDAPDTLTIRGSKPGQANVSSPFLALTEQKIRLTTLGNFEVGDIVLIMRCGSNLREATVEAEINRIFAVNPFSTPQRFLAQFPLMQEYGNDATVIGLQTVTYSINPGASGEPALWRSEFGRNEELVEGVQDFQVLYGVDNTGDGFANLYLTADKVANFGDVVSARIMLLVRSTDAGVNAEPQSYVYNGANITAGDRRLYQVFTNTIALRNRTGL